MGINAGQGQKTFEVQFLNAGLTVAGTFSVGGQTMDSWMKAFIHSQADVTDLTLSKFARRLANELQSRMLPDEKDGGSMVHIAGYVEEGGVYHPEFWFVRNVHAIDRRTGEYGSITHDFNVTEDFWTRDCPKANLMKRFQESAHTYHIYVNGFAPGRISYFILQHVMNQFLSEIWSNPDWKFRPPRSLDESETLVKLYMQVVTTLFLLSDYSAQFIGGGIQTYTIPQPPNIATSC